jgi:hypothetical protein
VLTGESMRRQCFCPQYFSLLSRSRRYGTQS